MGLFPLGWTLAREAHHVESAARMRRLADTTFRFHHDPKRAAKGAQSLVTAYPWMPPNLVAKMAAFGVDPTSAEAAEIAGMAAGRSARRGWIDQPGRRSPAEVRSVAIRPANPTPRSLDPAGTDEFDERRALLDDPRIQRAPDTDLLLGPTRAEDLGIGVPGGTDLSSSLQAERERLAFAYARAPSAGVFQGARPEAVGMRAGSSPEQIAELAGAAGATGNGPQLFQMADQFRQSLPALDTTTQHLRRGGLSYQGIPLPGGEVTADELRDAYLGPAGGQVADILRRKRQQLEAQYEGLADSEYPNLPAGITPAMRAVYDGIVSALDDVIDPERESIGPDLSVAGVDFNVSDLWNVPYDAARGTVRTATMAMDSLWQGGQAAFRQVVSDPTDVSNLAFLNPQTALHQPWEARVADGQFTFGNAPISETDFGIALERLASGDTVDTGAGFFVEPGSDVQQTRLEREREHGLIGGHVITMGRFAADTAGLEPDTVPFDVLSGAVDLAWLLVEPGGALVDVAARSRAFRRGLASAGGFAETRSLAPEMADRWMRTEQASAVFRHYADLDSPLAISRSYEEMSRAGGASRMPEWAHYQLADMDDPELVEETLRNLTGMGYSTPGVSTRAIGTSPGVAVRRRLSRSRLATDTPETGARALDKYDPAGFVGGIRDSLRNARVDEETIARIVHRAYTEGYVAPTRVRYQQIEREIAALPSSGPVLHRGTVMDAAVVRSELADTLDELRPGLFINKPQPRSGVLVEVWRDAQRAKRDRLIQAGVEPARAEDLVDTREVGRVIDEAYVSDLDHDSAFWLRLAAEDQPNSRVNRRVWGMLGGDPVTDLTQPTFAHMAAEHLARYLPLEDDYRQIARLTRSLPTQWANILLAGRKTGQLRWYGTVAEGFMDRIWKPSRLIRPAWPLRVVGEEQFRIGAVGFDSAVTHPMSYVALVMGFRRDGKMHRALSSVGLGEQGAMSSDALGRPWDAIAEHTSALNRAQRTWILPTGGGSGGRFDPFAYYAKEDGSFTQGYHMARTDLLARAHNDDIVRRIAQVLLGMGSEAGYDSIDELVEAGGGAVRNADELRTARSQNIIAMTRADLLDSHPELARRAPATFGARVAVDPSDELIESWDDYIESEVVRLQEMTGGDPDLMHAVARGRFPDGLTLDTPNTTRINRRAARRMESYTDNAPPVIGGDRSFHDRALGRRHVVQDDGYDRALERMFSLLGATPTDRLARSPAFRQFYWRRVQELLPYASEATQRRVLAEAANADLAERGFHIRMSAFTDDTTTSPTMASLRRASMQGKGDLTPDLLDELARRAALDNTRWLLYDVHKRGQFMDALRLVFPFGEAWKEVATRWMQLLAQRPGTVTQRATQILGATGTPQEYEDIVDDPSQHGFLFTNSTGETVFTYPFSGLINSTATGVPVELTGSLNGLTIMSSVLPGVGPVVQFPLSMSRAFRDSPEWEGVREALFPFGMGEDPLANPWGATTDLLLSPAAQRMIQGAVLAGRGDWNASNDRLFLNSVVDVMRWHQSTGEMNTNSPRAINRLLRESTEDAGLLYLIRGFAGMTLPSAPISEFQVEGNDGSLLMLRALGDQYRQLQDEDYSTAAQRFMEMHGDHLSLVLQAKTVPRSTMLPTTEEADRWVQSHPGIMDDYVLTFGLWAPGNTEGGDFDFDAYTRYANNRAMQVLGRELDLRDLVYLANDRSASLEYRQAEEEIRAVDGATTESGNLTEDAQRFLTTTVRPQLEERYPGFGSDGLERGPSADDLRRAVGLPGQHETEVRRMVDDERIDRPLRRAVSSYLDAHDFAIEEARSRGWSDTYYEAAAARPLRDFLRNTAYPQIREELPERYRARWDVVFERLFERLMIPSWEEEAEGEMEEAA